jgi:hypothetical protein
MKRNRLETWVDDFYTCVQKTLNYIEMYYERQSWTKKLDTNETLFLA